MSLYPLPPAGLISIRNADVYAPQSLGIRHLLIGGGKVLAISKSKIDLPSTLDIVDIDLEGRRLVPGLIDGHVHVTGGGGEAGFATRVPSLPLSAYTRTGVTSVIGLLGTDDVARGTRDLVATVNGLREQGLSAWAHSGGYHLPPATLTGSVRSDIVFIDCLIGAGEVAISDHRSSQPTLDEFLRLASEVHVAGLMTGKAGILHLHLGDGERGLDLIRRALDGSELPPRVFQPTHVNRRKALFEEALHLAKRGCTVDLTAFPVADGEDAWSAAQGLIRYLDSGAPADHVTVSSDAGGCLPCFDVHGHICSMDVGSSGAMLATLNELVASGIPLETALPPFTRNVADLLRLNDKGRITLHADADLVALDETGTANLVVARGRVHVREGSQVLRGMFE